ncbi:hypothetical protein Tco_0297385, partial [Tanacetum coccineum]
MERCFLSSKGSGGGRGVKEKSGGSIDVSAKVTGVMPSDAYGPVVVDENVRQKPSNSTDNPNK